MKTIDVRVYWGSYGDADGINTNQSGSVHIRFNLVLYFSTEIDEIKIYNLATLTMGTVRIFWSTVHVASSNYGSKLASSLYITVIKLYHKS